MTAPPDSSRQRDPAASQHGEAEETPSSSEIWGWTPVQRVGLGMMLGILLVFLVIDAVRRPAQVGDPAPMVGGQSLALAPRVDPNSASQEELAAVPHLGEKAAAAIVAYREARRGLAADGLVFHRAEELARVPGVTKAAASQAAGYLSFPDSTEAAATQEP